MSAKFVLCIEIQNKTNNNIYAPPYIFFQTTWNMHVDLLLLLFLLISSTIIQQLSYRQIFYIDNLKGFCSGKISHGLVYCLPFGAQLLPQRYKTFFAQSKY